MKLIGIAAALACAGLAVPALAQTTVKKVIVVEPAPPPIVVVTPVTPVTSATREGEIVVAPLRAPRSAFEISADVGYTQGFGVVRPGASVRDLAGAGMGLGIGLGYRATPTFSIAATGQVAGFNPSDVQPTGTTVRGATAGLEATFHIAPYERADPWVGVGAGYRMLLEVPEGPGASTLTHGFELGKVTVGLDLRPSENVAIAPVIGADVDMFRWSRATGAENARLTNPGLSTYVFAGVRGRFDVGGARETKIVHTQ